MNIRSTIFALVTLAMAGCSNSTGVVETGTPLPVTRFSDSRASFLYYSALGASERIVIRDDAAWIAAWSSLWPPYAPIPAPPPVDFMHQMVIFASLGTRSTGGYSITVDSAHKFSTGVTVFVGTNSPGAHCVLTQAFTSPVDIARVPRVDLPVEFRNLAKVENCD